MIIGLTVSEFGVWVGTTVPCIGTVMLWELGRSKYRSWAKHYTLCSLHSHILSVYCLEGMCTILYVHSQLLWILAIHLIQGSPTPGHRLLPVHSWLEMGHTSGGEWQASKQSFICIYSLSPSLTSPWCMEKLSSTKPVPGAKKIGDCWSNRFSLRKWIEKTFTIFYVILCIASQCSFFFSTTFMLGNCCSWTNKKNPHMKPKFVLLFWRVFISIWTLLKNSTIKSESEIWWTKC